MTRYFVNFRNSNSSFRVFSCRSNQPYPICNFCQYCKKLHPNITWDMCMRRDNVGSREKYCRQVECSRVFAYKQSKRNRIQGLAPGNRLDHPYGVLAGMCNLWHWQWYRAGCRRKLPQCLSRERHQSKRSRWWSL
jgi:hypothetical protein